MLLYMYIMYIFFYLFIYNVGLNDSEILNIFIKFKKIRKFKINFKLIKLNIKLNINFKF